MASRSGADTLMPSILDRLIDPESGGNQWRQGYRPQQMVEAVRRDLEDLLNSNQVFQDIGDEWVEVKNSLLSYGMPDFSARPAITPAQRKEVGRLIEDIINRFEPRLRNVHARLIDAGNLRNRTVRFHIDSRLNVDPSPEVAFETILELSTGHATISSSDPAS